MQTIYSINPAIAALKLDEIEDNKLASIYNVCTLFDKLKLKSDYNFPETLNGGESILSLHRKAKKKNKAAELENLIRFLFAGMMYRVKLPASQKMTTAELKVYSRDFIQNYPQLNLEGVIHFCQGAWQGKWRRGGEGKIFNRLDADVLSSMLKIYLDDWCVYKEAKESPEDLERKWDKLTKDKQNEIREKARKNDTLEYFMLTEEEKKIEYEKGTKVLEDFQNSMKAKTSTTKPVQKREIPLNEKYHKEFVLDLLPKAIEKVFGKTMNYRKYEREFLHFTISEKDYLYLRFGVWEQLDAEIIKDKLIDMCYVVQDLKAANKENFYKLTEKHNDWRNSVKLGLKNLVYVEPKNQ
jgi:hypothetical protein